MKTLNSTVSRLQKLENNMSFLSNVTYDKNLNLEVLNEDNTLDVKNTKLLDELRKLNTRREELLQSLMDM